MGGISSKLIKNALENIEIISYEIFKLNFTKQEKKTIEMLDIKINRNSQTNYNFYGNIDEFTQNVNGDIDSLIDFIKSIGDNSDIIAKEVSCIITNISNLLKHGYEKDYCWMTIRVVEGTKNFKVPRWHCDGKYFNPDKYPDPQTKFIMVLKGPGTLLIKQDDKIKTIYNNHLKKLASESRYASIEDRELLDIELKENGAEQIQLSNDEGLIFLAGHSNCTIHSEPDIVEPRIFLSFVFADEYNINEWKSKSLKKV